MLDLPKLRDARGRTRPHLEGRKRLFGRETTAEPAPQSTVAGISSRPAPSAETAPTAGPGQWISTLLEYEFRNDILSDKPYWEAAARGLGISKNPDVIPILESDRGSRAETTIAKVHHAFNWALGELQQAKAGDKWLEVDKDQVWQQIMMVSSQLGAIMHDAAKRNGVIRWYEEMKDVLPGVNLVVPGRDFSPADAKSRAWSMLATIIYYANNLDKSSFSVPCPEAKYCWEQALKLMPGDSYFTGCLRSVS